MKNQKSGHEKQKKMEITNGNVIENPKLESENGKI